MGDTSAVPASNPPASKALDSSRTPVRFQVRPVDWGERRRYEVVDTHTDTTLVVRATRHGADDDVIVLNLGGMGGPRVFGATVPEALELVGTRQCGRCRGIFPADPAGEPATRQDWWLCDPCRKTLVGRPPGPASEDAGVSMPTGLVVPAL
jgi:hypothetical protein